MTKTMECKYQKMFKKVKRILSNPSEDDFSFYLDAWSGRVIVDLDNIIRIIEDVEKEYLKKERRKP
jgi:hypothetical protein